MYRALILTFLLAGIASAQVTPRNILSSHFAAEDIRRDLVPRDKWQLYPKTAAEWRASLPQPVVQEIIRRGEQYLGKDVPAVSATLFLEYARNGNRSNYEAKSFARR